MPEIRITRRQFGLAWCSQVIPAATALAEQPNTEQPRAQQPGAQPTKRRSEAKSATQQTERSNEPPRWQILPKTPALPQPVRKGLLPINGAQIFFAQFGEGPPVLLLHGGTANSNYWGHQVGVLSKNFRVTVMDTRGHGRSPVVSGEFSYKLFARDVVELLGALDIPKTAVVGWSDGAITGIELAVNNTELVSGLFAYGANTSVDGVIAGGAASPVFGMFAARARQEYATLSPRPERWPQLQRGLAKMWRTEPNFGKAQLAKIASPITAADGEHDEIIKAEHTRQIVANIPRAELLMMANVSHFGMLQDPVQFNKALNTFLPKTL